MPNLTRKIRKRIEATAIGLGMFKVFVIDQEELIDEKGNPEMMPVFKKDPITGEDVPVMVERWVTKQRHIDEMYSVYKKEGEEGLTNYIDECTELRDEFIERHGINDMTIEQWEQFLKNEGITN